MLKERENVVEVSGLVGLRPGIDAGEYPGALVALVRHQVSCMMMSECDVESGTCGV